MDGELAVRIAPMASSGTLVRARLLLELRAAPVGDALADQAADRSRTPGAFATARSLLEAGSAAAVDNVEELYEIGLPRDLPGGLAAVAIAHKR